MKKIFISILLAAILLIFSCDPVSSYRKYINNQSQHDLKIYTYSSYRLDPSLKPYDSLIVKSNTKILLVSSTERSNAKICTNPKDSIVAFASGNDALKVTLDLNDEKNYTSSGSKYIIECTATIKSSDIVPK